MLGEANTILFSHHHLLFFLLLFIKGTASFSSSPYYFSNHRLESDKGVLLRLKAYLQENNRINQGSYAQWNDSDPNPCNWAGISCDERGTRVLRIDLRDSSISGPIFPNISLLDALTHLDLSKNTLGGPLPPDLNRCTTLHYLNLSHNLLCGSLPLPNLTRLEVLDLAHNRLVGPVHPNFPALCNRLVTLNLSTNNLTGDVAHTFLHCHHLRHLDLSANRFTGQIWPGISGLVELSLSENNLTGAIPPEVFGARCALRSLDLSQNQLRGEFPGTISNCSSLRELNILGNGFAGAMPSSVGALSSLEGLYLGRNRFHRDIPEELLNCSRLAILELSDNGFGGEVQPILGRFRQVRFLVLHSNNYTGGIEESGILHLPNIARLDLSYNRFSGGLPVGVANMTTLKFLILAFNNFSGKIPLEYGNMGSLQVLDFSFNGLTGRIPSSIGNLTSLLWLMLANNSLTGGIPPELGNCRSLLWLNLANNRLTGEIPPSITTIGRDPSEPFRANSLDDDGDGGVTAFSGECLSMRRWIPAMYPPFSFAYTIMTRKVCRTTWDRLLKGTGIFPKCTNLSSSYRTLRISGYVQLSGNLLSGGIPREIRGMKDFTLIHLDHNVLTGPLPREIADAPLVVLNVSRNRLSGDIPGEIGDIKCLRNLDLSYNNFSGEFPASFNKLTDLSKFNVSYNPLLTGTVNLTGQMGTFGEDSFIGNSLIRFFANGSRTTDQETTQQDGGRSGRRTWRVVAAFYVFLGLTMAFLAACALSSILLLNSHRRAAQPQDDLCHAPREDSVNSKRTITKPKEYHPWSPSALLAISSSTSAGSSASSSSSTAVRIFRKDCPNFTYEEVVRATGGFMEEAVIGRGGFGTVYLGIFEDGRRVAVKKLERDGEKEIRAEMEVMSGVAHGNLVALYGWCFSASEILLVYEYMEGGSLEDVIRDWRRLGWERRVGAAAGVARALVYLHHECDPPVVHRDVKASNVLMDGEGNARLTDFGLARVVRPEETHVSTMVAGTVGYVAPEYGQTWQATRKGDVYSFGVLVMELATGRRAVGRGGGDEEEGWCLVEWVRRRKGLMGWEGCCHLCMDDEEGVGGDGGKGGGAGEGWRREMGALLRVGMRCTAEAPRERPDMREVLAMLCDIKAVDSDTDKDDSRHPM